MPDRRRIRIGNQSAWSASKPLEPFEYALRRGFDAFEWFLDKRADGRGLSETDLPATTRAWIRQTALERDISLSVHGSWQATPLTRDGRRELASQAEFAADLGARLFVTHLLAADGLHAFADDVIPLAARLAGIGIQLAVENTPQSSPSDVNRLFGVVRRRGLQDAAGLCLDVGHANLSAETRNDYLAYVDHLAPDTPIVHVHLHENWGDADTHLTVFTGPAAFDASGVEGLLDRLVRRGFAGCLILEQWPEPRDLLGMARDRLARMVLASTAKRGAG